LNGPLRMPLPSFIARTLALAVAAAVAPAIASCSGEASFLLPSVDAGAPSSKYASVCAAWAAAECAYESTCYVSVFVRWENDSQCRQRRAILCELLGDDPDVAFDPQLVQGCTFPADCTGVQGTAGTAGTPPLCLPPGKAPDGSSCVWDADCRSNFCSYSYDAYGTPSDCGKCETLDLCQCGPNAECVYHGANVQCVGLPSLGQACGAPLYGCLQGQCVVADGATTGQCTMVPQATVGEACSARALGPDCSGTDTFCDPNAQTCRVYRPGAYGDPCTDATGGEGVVCIGAGSCDDGASGLCLPPAPDSEPCDEAQGVSCLPPARCLGHACVFPSQGTCSR
jgi:hypothetical protein